MIFAFSVCYVSNGYIFYALTYLEKFPVYICDKNIVPEDRCNSQFYCQHKDEPNLIRIDESSIYTLDNWVDRLDLTCKSSTSIGLIGSMYLFGWSLGCLFIPRFGDLYGRRKPFLVCMFLSLLVYLGLILSQNLLLTTVLFALLGLCTPGKSNVAYIYVMEIVPAKKTTPVGTVLLIADGSTMIFLSIYFRFISKNWLYFQLFCIILSSIAFGITILCPESPKYLYSYKKYKEARQSIERIA
jgi:MFS family permease